MGFPIVGEVPGEWWRAEESRTTGLQGVSVDRFFHRNPHVFHTFSTSFAHSSGRPETGRLRVQPSLDRAPLSSRVRAAHRREFA